MTKEEFREEMSYRISCTADDCYECRYCSVHLKTPSHDTDLFFSQEARLKCNAARRPWYTDLGYICDAFCGNRPS